MNSSLSIGLAFGVALLPAAVLAEPLDLKPGLWESTVTLETSGAPPVDLDKYPPEQRARMESALKKQQAQGPRKHTRVTKSCVTREQLSQTPFEDLQAVEKQGESCKRTIATATSKRWQGKVECSGKVAIVAEFSVEALSRESVKGKTTSHASGNGRSMSTSGTFVSKWVSATCEKK